MHILLILTVCMYTFVSPANLPTGRRYFAHEEKYNENRFMPIPDDNGQVHIVDLHLRDVDFELMPEDITVYFYSAENPSVGHKFSTHDFTGHINHKDFDPARKTIFVTHGWTGYNTSYSCRTMKNAFLVKNEANIFVIDWHRPAHEFYTVARSVVPEIGRILAGFIDKLLDTYNIDASMLLLIGHSLGAQVIGATGAAMKNKPGAIMGLDPAHPLFYMAEPENRLDITDAQIVNVVHTNAGFLGYLSSLGHADYWANGGGQSQPGCGVDIVGYCAHERAVDFFVESINSKSFKSLKCDSYDSYQNGLCDANEVAYFGGLHIDLEARGDFYFDTNSESPYAQN